MCFPVWRELKRIQEKDGWHTGEFKCAFPFEGNWNPLRLRLYSQPFSLCLNVLSRLKGIETGTGTSLPVHALVFKCAFPFEGNWNHISVLGCGAKKEVKFKCAFPFEGNWNRTVLSVCILNLLSLNVLSRLKGIETGGPDPFKTEWIECV